MIHVKVVVTQLIWCSKSNQVNLLVGFNFVLEQSLSILDSQNFLNLLDRGNSCRNFKGKSLNPIEQSLSILVHFCKMLYSTLHRFCYSQYCTKMQMIKILNVSNQMGGKIVVRKLRKILSKRFRNYSHSTTIFSFLPLQNFCWITFEHIKYFLGVKIHQLPRSKF